MLPEYRVFTATWKNTAKIPNIATLAQVHFGDACNGGWLIIREKLNTEANPRGAQRANVRLEID